MADDPAPSRQLGGSPPDAGVWVLEPYEEIRGRLVSLRETDRYVVVELSSGTLRYPVNSPAGKLCRRALAGRDGQPIAVLRVPNPDQPLIIQVEGADTAVYR